MENTISIHTDNGSVSVKAGDTFTTKAGKVFEIRYIILSGWTKSGHHVKDSIKMAEVGTEAGTITHAYTPRQFASRFF
jgi:hypothetical protein